jgi:hypothetical protein
MNQETSPLPTDGCPLWAQEMIDQLRQIEIYLGNIPKSLSWESAPLELIAKRSFHKDQATFTEEKAHLVFCKIVKRLVQEGASHKEIADWINARIGYKGGPKYCDDNDIMEAL